MVLAQLEQARVVTRPDSSPFERTAGICVTLTVLAQLERARVVTRPDSSRKGNCRYYHHSSGVNRTPDLFSVVTTTTDIIGCWTSQ